MSGRFSAAIKVVPRSYFVLEAAKAASGLIFFIPEVFKMKKLIIADTTLRQAAKNRSRSLSFKEKIEIAKLLDKLSVDVLELAPLEDEKTDTILTKSICSSVENAVVALPCALSESGIAAAWETLSKAEKPRLQLVVPTSTVQMEFVCKKKPPLVLSMIAALVPQAKRLCNDVEFVAQDATRSERAFLYEAIKAAVSCGASTVTLCDNAGIMTSEELSAFVGEVYENVPELKNVTLGVRCSDEFSFGCACAFSAALAGAKEIKTAVCGEGTVSTEIFSRFLSARGSEFSLKTSLKTTMLERICGQIERIVKAEKSKTTPFETGVSASENSFVLSEYDTPEQVAAAVHRLGYDLSDEENANVFEAFSRISGKKSVTAKELDVIVATAALQVPSTYFLESYVVNIGNIITPTAHITLSKDGKSVSGLCAGDGPVDASFLAIEKITGHHYELDDFQIQAVTEGREAMGSALVRLRSKGKVYSGNGISTDVVGASIRAYINALNKIVYEEEEE